MAYSVDWKGLDQGVEFTWKPEVIEGCLKTIAKHAPFEHRNRESPFYDEIEKMFPKKTWRAEDADGSFRPIFRRSNTWKKLGLILEDDRKFSLSLTGSQLLDGKISLQEVFSRVLRNHVEKEEKPYVVLASLLSQLPPGEVNVDFILQLLHHWRPGDDLQKAVRNAEKNGFEKDSDEYKLRKRRINSMLGLLASMGGISLTGGLIRVTNGPYLSEFGQIDSLETDIYSDLNIEIDSKKRKKPIGGSPRRRELGKNDVGTFRFDAARQADPEGRLRLIERATQSHEDTVSMLTEFFATRGYISNEHSITYDLHTPISKEFGFLSEIKTVHAGNCKKQLRAAITQLSEYDFFHKEELCQNNQHLIVVDQDPTNLISDEKFFDYLENWVGVLLIWFENGVPATTKYSKTRLKSLIGI